MAGRWASQAIEGIVIRLDRRGGPGVGNRGNLGRIKEFEMEPSVHLMPIGFLYPLRGLPGRFEPVIFSIVMKNTMFSVSVTFHFSKREKRTAYPRSDSTNNNTAQLLHGHAALDHDRT
jgi:hypothetical protein